MNITFSNNNNIFVAVDDDFDQIHDVNDDLPKESTLKWEGGGMLSNK